MKRIIAVLAILCLFAAAGCDEKKTIQAIRTGQATAQTLALSTYTAVTILHTSGKITDAQWAKFEAVYQRYSTANTLLTDALKAWDAGVGKPTVERIQVLLESLNQIIGDINELIDAWKIKTAQLPVVRLRA